MFVVVDSLKCTQSQRLFHSTHRAVHDLRVSRRTATSSRGLLRERCFESTGYVLRHLQLPRLPVCSAAVKSAEPAKSDKAKRHSAEVVCNWSDSSVQLRDYQIQAIDAISRLRHEGCSRQLVSLPTGTGKTVIFAALCRFLQLKALVIVHTVELAQQTVEQIKRIWPGADVGVIQGRNKRIGGDITVATIQTVRRAPVRTLVQSADVRLLLVDEAHHSVAVSYSTLLEKLGFDLNSNKRLAVGFTATPYRLGQRSTHQLYEIWPKMAFERSTDYMMGRKYLSPVVAARVLTYTDLDDVKIQRQDFAVRQLSNVVNSSSRNKLIVDTYKSMAEGRKAVAFCVDVDHALALARALNASAVAAAAVYGDMSETERQETLERFRTGHIRVLTNCMILTEGFDDPTIDCVLMARPTRSQGLFTQCVGRGFRLAEGKKDCLVIDFTDSYHTVENLANIQDVLPSAGYFRDEYKEQQEKQPRTIEVETEGGKFDILGQLAWASFDMSHLHVQSPVASAPIPFSCTFLSTSSGTLCILPLIIEQSLVYVLFEVDKKANVSSRYTCYDTEEDAKHGAIEKSGLDANELRRWRSDAAWRRYPASAPQLRVLASLDETVSPLISKGEASTLISCLFLQRDAAVILRNLLNVINEDYGIIDEDSSDDDIYFSDPWEDAWVHK